MTCKTDLPHVFFRSFDPPYMSGDIDPGLLPTETPVAGNGYTAQVSFHNDGLAMDDPVNGVADKATVSLWAFQAGTTPSSATFAGSQDKGIAACSGSFASNSASLPYHAPMFGSASHYCLLAKVRDNVTGSDGQLDPPGWDLDDTGDPTMPDYLRIAQRNVFIIAGGGSAGTALARALHFGFAVVNPFARDLTTQVIANVITKRDDALIARIQNDAQLKPLLKRGRLRFASRAGIAAGVERRYAGEQGFEKTAQSLATKLKVDVRTLEPLLPRPSGLSHVGPLTPSQASAITVRASMPEQTMGLRKNEVRQAIVDIHAPDDAEPGDIFGVDVRHELVRRSNSDEPRLIGGLIVFLRIPRHDDPKPKLG